MYFSMQLNGDYSSDGSQDIRKNQQLSIEGLSVTQETIQRLHNITLAISSATMSAAAFECQYPTVSHTKRILFTTWTI